MSFDLYLQVFRAGKPSGFSPDTLRRIFAGHLSELEEDFWQLGFANEQSTDLFLQAPPDDPSSIHTLSVHRPCEDPRLWSMLYAALAAAGAVFHFPGCAAPLTRDPSLATALPPGLLSSLGTPMLVADGPSLRKAVGNL